MSFAEFYIMLVLAVPYVYVLVKVASMAYFNVKLDYQRRVFRHLEQEELEKCP